MPDLSPNPLGEPEITKEAEITGTEAMIQALLKAIRTNPDVIKRVRNAVLDNDEATNAQANPQRYGDKVGRVPYYKEYFAKSLIPILDNLKSGDKDKVIPYSLFPHLAHGTLMNRVGQSWLYVIDHLDPDGSYCELREQIEVCRGKAGVLLHWLCKLKSGSVMTAVDVDDLEFEEVRTKLSLVLSEAAIGQKYEMTGFTLSDKDVATLETSVLGLENFVVEILQKKIVVRRME